MRLFLVLSFLGAVAVAPPLTADPCSGGLVALGSERAQELEALLRDRADHPRDPRQKLVLADNLEDFHSDTAEGQAALSLLRNRRKGVARLRFDEALALHTPAADFWSRTLAPWLKTLGGKIYRVTELDGAPLVHVAPIRILEAAEKHPEALDLLVDVALDGDGFSHLLEAMGAKTPVGERLRRWAERLDTLEGMMPGWGGLLAYTPHLRTLSVKNVPSTTPLSDAFVNAIPTSVESLRLSDLHVAHESVLAKKIQTLEHLRDLSLGGTNVTGAEVFPVLPRSLERLELYSLDGQYERGVLDENALAGRMAHLKQLRALSVRHSRVTGTALFRSLGDQLEELDLFGLNGSYGAGHLDENALAEGLGRWTRLRSLDVGSSAFQGTRAFPMLPESLESLSLWGLDREWGHGNIDDLRLAKRLPKLVNLKSLDLGRSPYRGRFVYPALPTGLRRLVVNREGALATDDEARRGLVGVRPSLEVVDE